VYSSTGWHHYAGMSVLAVLLLGLVSAQSTSFEGQTLRGVVRDQTSAVLQNAQVELRDSTGAIGAARAPPSAFDWVHFLMRFSVNASFR
jgi:hypothetical protein